MEHFASIAGMLEENGLDAVLLTCEANRFYASDFFSSGTDGIALVTKNHCYYFTDSRYTEAAARQIQNAEIRQADRATPYSALINEVIEKEHLQTLGFEDEYLTVADWERYKKKLHCTLVPATEPLWKLRAVKDQAELDRMVQAQRIAEKALTDILKEIRPGVTERELAALLLYKMLRYGAEDKSFDPIVVSGPNGSLPHGVPSDRPLQAGEFVTMDFGCKFGGYCSDMTRTVAVSHVTEEMETVYQTVLQAQCVGIAAAKAGVTGTAVDSAARTVIKDAGYGAYFGHGFGHSLGVEIHENPSFSAANEKPLPAGAVLSAEPGIYLPGRMGVRIEDVIVLTETGCENITLAPKELLVL